MQNQSPPKKNKQPKVPVMKTTAVILILVGCAIGAAFLIARNTGAHRSPDTAAVSEETVDPQPLPQARKSLATGRNESSTTVAPSVMNAGTRDLASQPPEVTGTPAKLAVGQAIEILLSPASSFA